MVSPTVQDFLDITGARGAELQLAEVHVTDGSSLVGELLIGGRPAGDGG